MNNSTKFVLDMFKSNKRPLNMIILVAALGALLTVITPYVYGKLFDLAIISNTTENILLSLIGLWLILSLISTYVSNMTGYMGEVLGTKMSQEAEAEAYSHFLTLPILFHKKEQRGEILQKISRGSRSLQDIIETIADVSPQLLMLLFSLIAMFIIKWQLALIVFISFVVYALSTIRFVKPEIAAHRMANKIYEKQYGNYQE